MHQAGTRWPRPSIRFHSGTRTALRCNQGNEVRPHPAGAPHPPRAISPVSPARLPPRLCQRGDLGPAGRGHGGVRGPSLSSAERTLRCRVPVCTACPGRFLEETGAAKGAGMGRSVWVHLGGALKGSALSVFSRPGCRLWDHPAVPDGHLLEFKDRGGQGCNVLEGRSPSVMVGCLMGRWGGGHL